MANTVTIIPLHLLLLGLLPAFSVLLVYARWGMNYKEGLYAISRLFGQLLVVGYFLGYIFQTKSVWIVLAVLTVMVVASSWIALRTVAANRSQLFFYACVSISLCGGLTLMLVTQIIVDIKPWYQPQFMVPLGSMIFASCMNAISLGAERYFEERERGELLHKAKSAALRTALIPMTNSMFAVGLVSFPGMMTGQVLSGVDPLIAARYQIMVMSMLFGASGLSCTLFLKLLASNEAEIIKASN